MTGLLPGTTCSGLCTREVVSSSMEKALSLKPEKLKASRDVLYDYGNMSGASVLFVLDQMRNLSTQTNSKTTGHGAERGVAVASGPGLTLQISILKAASTPFVKMKFQIY
ncbi:unnamed protein product [Calypogeia fissa]